jgi:molecular chaperone DnaK
MVADAEANKEEDKKFHELVATRNKADQLVHATRSALKEHGGKVPADQLSTIEGALSDLEKVKDGDDKAAIESKIQKLEQVAQALYAAAQSGGDAGAQSAPGGGSAQPDDVVDAEFTEVKNDGKSA